MLYTRRRRDVDLVTFQNIQIMTLFSLKTKNYFIKKIASMIVVEINHI